MSYSVPVVLLASQTSDGSAGLLFDDGGGFGLNHPTSKPGMGWADEITFIISVCAIFGAPTTWSVSAKLQFLQPHTRNYQFQQPRWFDLQRENILHNVVEQCGFYGGPNAGNTLGHPAPLDGSFGIIADNTDTAPTESAPITVQRTVRNFGDSARVVLSLAHTGGTGPRAGVAITMIPKAY